MKASRKQHPLTPELRQRIIDMYIQDNRKPKEITRMLHAVHTKVAYRTVARLIGTFKKTGEMAPKPKGGSHSDQKTPDIACKRIRELVLENNEHSASTIQCHLDRNMKEKISILPLVCLQSMHLCIE